MDVKQFLIEFQDYLAPKLDTYEQAIYLYILRKNRLLEQDEVTISARSERTKMAIGIGKAGTPMSDRIFRKKLKSLEAKGCFEIQAILRHKNLATTERYIRRLRELKPALKVLSRRKGRLEGRREERKGIENL